MQKGYSREGKCNSGNFRGRQPDSNLLHAQA
jgi:hypothetical protein